MPEARRPLPCYLRQLFWAYFAAVIGRMGLVRKCPKCGLELIGTSVAACSVCGAAIASKRRPGIWIGALVQFGISTIFMLAIGFPKIMILIFGGMILLGTAVSSVLKPNSTARQVIPQKPLSHPVLFRVVGIGIALCTLAIVATLLFGFVIFMNSWTKWHQYEGQPFHRAEFQVEQVYYQKQSKSYDVYARGRVDGQREWMSLQPYLHVVPRSQTEAESRVPVGTLLDIYLFPGLKGRSRVQVYRETPPAEANHQAAIAAVNKALIGLAIAGGMLFLLTRVRRMCFVPNSELQPAGLAS